MQIGSVHLSLTTNARVAINKDITGEYRIEWYHPSTLSNGLSPYMTQEELAMFANIILDELGIAERVTESKKYELKDPREEW